MLGSSHVDEGGRGSSLLDGEFFLTEAKAWSLVAREALRWDGPRFAEIKREARDAQTQDWN